MITINATGDTTLHTAGKYCAEDILVKVPSGGSGSGNVETCTVTINSDGNPSNGFTVGSICYVTMESGVPKIKYENTDGDNFTNTSSLGGELSGFYTINCVVGTDILLFDDNLLGVGSIVTSSNATQNDNILTFMALAVTIDSGVAATITVKQ